MSKQKHTGENVASVTVQMRFIPLKKDPEQQKFIPLKTDNKQPATIVVRVNDTQKRTPDNTQEFNVENSAKYGLLLDRSEIRGYCRIMFLNQW